MLDDAPDWSGEFAETLTWATTIALPRDGVEEERRCVAPTPTRFFRFDAWDTDGAADMELHTLYSDDTRELRWLPGAVRTTNAGAGLTQLNLADHPHLFGIEADRGLLVVSPDGSVQITEVTGESPVIDAVFVAPAVNVEPCDYIVPTINARLNASLGTSRPFPSLGVHSLDARALDSARWPLTAGVDTEFELASAYDPDVDTLEPSPGAEPVEVFWRKPDAQIGGYSRRIEQLSSGAGAHWFGDVSGITRNGWTQDHVFTEPQDVWSFRRMLYRRRGRFAPCFVPQGHAIEYLGPRENAGIDYYAIPDLGWTVDAGDARGAVVVHLQDGTRLYHTFTEIADSAHALPVPAGEGWLVGLYPPATALPVADVCGLDWLVYARLSDDAITVTWGSTRTASASIGWAPIQWPETWPTP